MDSTDRRAMNVEHGQSEKDNGVTTTMADDPSEEPLHSRAEEAIALCI